MFDGLRKAATKRKLHKQAQEAFLNGAGATGRRWSIHEDRTTMVDELTRWLRARIAETATPYGIDGCCILVRLSHNGTSVTWPHRSAAFARTDPTAAIAGAAATVAALTPDDYPTATHIEVYLLSLGDVARYHMPADTHRPGP